MSPVSSPTMRMSSVSVVWPGMWRRSAYPAALVCSNRHVTKRTGRWFSVLFGRGWGLRFPCGQVGRLMAMDTSYWNLSPTQCRGLSLINRSKRCNCQLKPVIAPRLSCTAFYTTRSKMTRCCRPRFPVISKVWSSTRNGRRMTSNSGMQECCDTNQLANCWWLTCWKKMRQCWLGSVGLPCTYRSNSHWPLGAWMCNGRIHWLCPKWERYFLSRWGEGSQVWTSDFKPKRTGPLASLQQSPEQLALHCMCGQKSIRLCSILRLWRAP